VGEPRRSVVLINEADERVVLGKWALQMTVGEVA